MRKPLERLAIFARHRYRLIFAVFGLLVAVSGRADPAAVVRHRHAEPAAAARSGGEGLRRHPPGFRQPDVPAGGGQGAGGEGAGTLRVAGRRSGGPAREGPRAAQRPAPHRRSDRAAARPSSPSRCCSSTPTGARPAGRPSFSDERHPPAGRASSAGSSRRRRGSPLKQLARLDPLGLAEIFLGRLESSRGTLNVDWTSGYYLSRDHRLLLILAEPVSRRRTCRSTSGWPRTSTARSRSRWRTGARSPAPEGRPGRSRWPTSAGRT